MDHEEIAEKSIKLRDFLMDEAERFGEAHSIPACVQLATFVAIGKMIERRVAAKTYDPFMRILQ